MKTKLLILIISLFTTVPLISFASADLADRLSGRILLQVEEKGEAWYVNPTNKNRYFLGRPDDAFQIMRELGLGITEKDFNSFKDKAPQRLSGKILLRVEANGEAYYVSPVDLKIHFLGRPVDSFNVMRNLGLGTTNDDLKKIIISSSSKNIDLTKTTEDVLNKDNLSKKFIGKGNSVLDNFYVSGEKIKVSFLFKAQPSSYGFFFGEEGIDGHDFVIVAVKDEENKLISGCQDYKNFDNEWSSYLVCKTGEGNFHISVESKATTNWSIGVENYK